MEISISDSVSIDAQTVMTGRGCVIGQSGSGKSYLLGVIVEELCKLNLPFVFIDTEGEYVSLKKEFHIIHIGEDPEADLDLNTDYQRVFKESMANGIPVILDLSDVLDKKERAFVALKALYELENNAKKPYLVVIEEADKFVPQVLHKEQNIVEEIGVRGRKRGIGLLIATQRPANVSKNALSQCSYGFVGKLSLVHDIKAVSILFEQKKMATAIPKLSTGSFMSFGLPVNGQVFVKKRMLEPSGGTPRVEAAVGRNVDFERMMGDIKKSIEKIAPDEYKRRKEMSMDANVLEYQFTLEDAKEYADRVALKEFVLFGAATEKLESLEQMYIQAELFLVRVPTDKKNEYMDHYIMFRGMDMVQAKTKISFIRPHIEKPIALNRYEREILSMLAKEMVLPMSQFQIAQKLQLREETTLRHLNRLKKAGLLREEGGNYSFISYNWHLLFSQPALVKTSIDRGKVINYLAKPPKGLELLMTNIFPDCESSLIGTVYIPVYRITLRHRNKLRVLLIDGIYGSEV